MIGNAIVAAEDRGGDQSKQFFCLGAERARLVGLMVESKEALDAEVAASEDFLVQIGAKFLKVFQAIGHDSSGGQIPAHQSCPPSWTNFCSPVRARNSGYVTLAAEHFAGQRARHIAPLDDRHPVDEHVLHPL